MYFVTRHTSIVHQDLLILQHFGEQLIQVSCTFDPLQNPIITLSDCMDPLPERFALVAPGWVHTHFMMSGFEVIEFVKGFNQKDTRKRYLLRGIVISKIMDGVLKHEFIPYKGGEIT